MIIKFKKIIICNFMSLGNIEIKLDNQGYTLISGINNNPIDMATSNGAGKSSIFSAISYALTGETLNGLTRNLTNIHTEGGMYVKLEFKVDEDDFTIIRSKDHKEFGTNLKIIINNQDKSGKGIRDSEKLLAEYLPDLTSSLLSSVIILGQGMPQRFSSNTPSGRKEILEKLTKSDFMIEDIKQRITTRKDILNKNLRLIEDKLLELNTFKRGYEKSLEQSKNILKEFEIKPDFENDIKNINNSILEIKDKLEYIQKVKSEYNLKSESIVNNLLSIDNQINVEIDESLKPFKDEFEKHQKTLMEMTAKEKSLSDTIEKYKSVVDICPTCGQKLPNIHKIDTKLLVLEHQDLLSTINELEEIIKQKKNNIQQTEQNIRRKYQEKKIFLNESLSDNKKNLSSVNSDEFLLNSKLNSLNIDLIKVQNEQATFDNKLAKVKQDITYYTEQIESSDKDILYNTDVKETINNKLFIINKISTIATRDFRGFLLSNIINFIDTKAKEYALEVFDNDKINFELDGNNISITFDNKPIENLSGGERQKIDLIVQFAIRDMLCQYMNFSSNILVIDEAFDFLDYLGCQKVVDMISHKLCDVESVFIISHHKDLSLPIDNEITIVKNNNGISELV